MSVHSPDSMKAVAIDRFGPPNVLKLRTLSVPRVGANEVLVAVHATPVNSWELPLRDGSWAPDRPKFPLIIGTDGAGVVVGKGARVRRLRVGDRVWAFSFENPKSGFYAEYAAVNANSVGPIPRRLNAREAAAAFTPALTALQGIDEQIRLRAGETVLIFGATGAVGMFAVQFAKWRRARVIATASNPAGARFVKRLGASAVIDPRRGNVDEQLRKLAPRGLDAVLAFAGGKGLERCLEHVRANGRVVYPNGVEPEPRGGRRTFRLKAYDADPNPRAFAKLNRAVTAARLRVPIAKVYPLAQAARAHAQLQRGHVLGRIVLAVRPPIM